MSHTTITAENMKFLDICFNYGPLMIIFFLLLFLWIHLRLVFTDYTKTHRFATISLINLLLIAAGVSFYISFIHTYRLIRFKNGIKANRTRRHRQTSSLSKLHSCQKTDISIHWCMCVSVAGKHIAKSISKNLIN